MADMAVDGPQECVNVLGGGGSSSSSGGGAANTTPATAEGGASLDEERVWRDVKPTHPPTQSLCQNEEDPTFVFVFIPISPSPGSAAALPSHPAPQPTLSRFN
ncbi:hypothetical protein GJ744_001017 [Endocarpon pusillum]|uniref:Uncharacterized protein n=1 Tax=Endocarpon pusillum TaxID=364733 RepID=A0A8H7DZS2_9EURO|nr:hypothetical protein GJ744_001017 [Endocarpon pusillum]